MSLKFQFQLLGWITLLVFPAIGLGLLWFFKDLSIAELLAVFELKSFWNPLTLLGLEFGLLYGFFILAVSNFSIFDELAGAQTRLLRNLQLNWPAIIFMSLCAGIGEELLFRAGIQTFLGPWITSVLFIAVHGYLNPLSLKKSLLGILLFPFIILIAYAYDTFGLWFCIAAHFSYDLLMFMGVIKAI